MRMAFLAAIKHRLNAKVVFVICIFSVIGTLCIVGNGTFVNVVYNVQSYVHQNTYFSDTRWTWTCINKQCIRSLANTTDRTSLETCNMLCDEPQLWPFPTGKSYFGNRTASFFSQQIFFQTEASELVIDTIEKAYMIFNEYLLNIQRNKESWSQQTDIKEMTVSVVVRSQSLDLTLDTKEEYSLLINKLGHNIIVNITAETYYGARHALETLSQLIWKSADDQRLKILYPVSISDSPAFPYRGVMVDTARNFFPLWLLKKVVDGMSANKLNVFHWHITDTQSFPLKSNNTLKHARLGAYNPVMTYNESEISDFIEFAKIRGVRVIIEVDAPAHVSRGWEWGVDENIGKLIVCEEENFMEGQLNAENPKVLDIIEGIYKDLFRLNTNNEIFHIGGDEVDTNCWSRIAGLSYRNVYHYWGRYVKKMLERVKRANNGSSPKHTVMWSSPLTQPPHLEKYFDKKNVVIQSWLGPVQPILDSGFHIIFSTVGKWYLDCGFGKWRESSPAVCDPYTPWQTFYSYNPWKEYNAHDSSFGGEVCLWAEQVEVNSLETRIWPRSAAFAERMWSNINNPPIIPQSVYLRLDTQRTRMITRGLEAEGMWPRYCSQNPGKCT